MKTAVIMQPTYLPWVGYFDLMDQSDYFIFLDSVQFDKRSWQQRNRIKTPNGEMMLTVPVYSKGKYTQSICDVRIDTTKNFQEKHIKTIQQFYSKAAFYSQYFDKFNSILRKEYSHLVDLNIDLILFFKELLGIQREIARSSLLELQGKKVELLYNICKIVKADCYLSPIGSKNYIDENNLFEKNGMALRYHNYQHPVYRQLYGEFIPYLSVIDLLLNEGENGLAIIRTGRVVS
jgi:hypothetical protein